MSGVTVRCADCRTLLEVEVPVHNCQKKWRRHSWAITSRDRWQCERCQTVMLTARGRKGGLVLRYRGPDGRTWGDPPGPCPPAP